MSGRDEEYGISVPAIEGVAWRGVVFSCGNSIFGPRASYHIGPFLSRTGIKKAFITVDMTRLRPTEEK